MESSHQARRENSAFCPWGRRAKASQNCRQTRRENGEFCHWGRRARTTHWHRFGKNLIGVTHGDTVKAQQLGPVMACDRPEDWGETAYRFWYTGHVHQNRYAISHHRPTLLS